MAKELTTITIRASMPTRWVPHFLGMLNRMEYLGNIGSSRRVSIFADGDGDFQPKFRIRRGLKFKKLRDMRNELAKAVTEDKGGNQFFDAG